MMVSAPQRVAHTIFSTSSAIEEVTAELPILALIFTTNFLPMIIGSLSGWLWLAGITARPRATSSRTSSGRNTLAGGDERHLGGDLAGAGTLQLGAAVARPRRAAAGSPCVRGRSIASGSVYGPGGVVQVEVLAVGQVHPAERHPCAGHAVEVAVDLGAARDRAGGDG